MITKLIVRSTLFGDVEVLSDLFLREPLERLHVPHSLDWFRRKLALYSASPNVSSHVLGSPPTLLPRARVPLSKKPTKSIPRVGVEMLKKTPPKSIPHFRVVL